MRLSLMDGVLRDIILAVDFDDFITNRKSIQNSYHVDDNKYAYYPRKLWKSWFIMNREFFYDIRPDDDDNDIEIYVIENVEKHSLWLSPFESHPNRVSKKRAHSRSSEFYANRNDKK